MNVRSEAKDREKASDTNVDSEIVAELLWALRVGEDARVGEEKASDGVADALLADKSTSDAFRRPPSIDLVADSIDSLQSYNGKNMSNVRCSFANSVVVCMMISRCHAVRLFFCNVVGCQNDFE